MKKISITERYIKYVSKCTNICKTDVTNYKIMSSRFLSFWCVGVALHQPRYIVSSQPTWLPRGMVTGR